MKNTEKQVKSLLKPALKMMSKEDLIKIILNVDEALGKHKNEAINDILINSIENYVFMSYENSLKQE
jgi:hypothetical protein